MFAKLNSIGLFGLESYTIAVECDTSSGLPAFDIVGLPDASVRESRNRVRSSTVNCGYEFPSLRITVNLAPASTPKEGSSLDLPILISLLQATNQLNCELDDCAFIGELSLTGDIRPVNGLLAMAIHAKDVGIKRFFIPHGNAAEASVLEGIEIYPVDNITDLIAHLQGKILLKIAREYYFPVSLPPHMPDFADVKGQYNAKLALEISAAGGHNILLIGPPGSGKSMLAKRLPSILPPLSFEESLESTKIHSICGALPPHTPLITTRPFRSPHHSVSVAGLTGGGSVPKPGEISLSHFGVLFLDEFPEFSRLAMEALRQPIEDSFITISRVSGSFTYPCSISLVAAMNPCPCGFFGDTTKQCSCPKPVVQKYLQRVSGPMLDRLDVHVEVPSVSYNDLTEKSAEESSEKVKERVVAARALQTKRYNNEIYTTNAKIPSDILKRHCKMDFKAEEVLQNAFNNLSLSARGYDKVVRIARTIADLEDSKNVLSSHVSSAIKYRTVSKKYWL